MLPSRMHRHWRTKRSTSILSKVKKRFPIKIKYNRIIFCSAIHQLCIFYFSHTTWSPIIAFCWQLWCTFSFSITSDFLPSVLPSCMFLLLATSKQNRATQKLARFAASTLPVVELCFRVFHFRTSFHKRISFSLISFTHWRLNTFIARLMLAIN